MNTKINSLLLRLTILVVFILTSCAQQEPKSPPNIITPENTNTVEQINQRETGTVYDVTYSNDGSILAIASTIGIYLYDSQSFELVRLIETPQAIGRAVFSEDGKNIASLSFENEVQLWNIEDGSLLKTMQGVSEKAGQLGKFSRIFDIALSSSELLLIATTSLPQENLVYLIRAEDGTQVQTFETHTDIYLATLSPDANTLASVSWVGDLQLWDVKTGELISTDSAPTSSLSSLSYRSVYDIAFSPNGQFLAHSGQSTSGSGMSDEYLSFYRVDKGEETGVEVGYGGDTKFIAMSVSFSSDGKSLAVSFDDGTIQIWDVGNNVLQKTINATRIIRGFKTPYDQLKDRVVDSAFSPDGQNLAYWSNNDQVTIWDIPNNVLLHTFEFTQ